MSPRKDRPDRHGTRAAIVSLLWAALLLLGEHSKAGAQEDPVGPRPVTNVTAIDAPYDVGDAIDVVWELSPDDQAGQVPPPVLSYEVSRKGTEDSDFAPIGEQTYQSRHFRDTRARRGAAYLYRVIAIAPDGARSPPALSAEPVVATMQFFRGDRGWLAVIVAVVCGAVATFVALARAGYTFYVRPIPGLQAVDEAVGRATEMGRPCLFVPGIQDINDIQTVAGITVLGHVAKLTADYGASLDVPTCRSMVMTAARETVAASYLTAGRPDAFREDDIYYLTDEQFGYVAGVTGKMVRDKPAACFYMGSFFAESLLFAEIGNSIGSIQVAGTAQPSQLPFFVAACDYTLLGEEFFAASAYLSGEPVQLGSLRGQDLGKLLGAILIVVGCFAATVAALSDREAEGNGAAKLAGRVAAYLQQTVLGSGESSE